MNSIGYYTLALSCVLALVAVGCGDDENPGFPDSGTDSGVDSGPPGDDSGVDAGPPPGDAGDAGMTDGGTLPTYCPTIGDPGAAPTCPPLASRPVVEIAPGDDLEQTGALSWTCENTYHLRNTLFMMSGTLTIGAGTHVIGDNAAALVITQGASIDAVGHPDAPIVFTSSQDVGSRNPGDWGGVVLLGDAPINTTGSVPGGGGMLPTGVNAIEGLPSTDTRGRYGGADAAHDCGTIRYARIEYAGFLFGADNELNALTMGGCGTATEIDHVQTHLGLDDGFEMFGGAPNLRFVIASGIDDDGLDWDLGYTGTIQYGVVDRLGLLTTGSTDPNGIEADSHPTTFDSAPRSNPTVFNITLVGQSSQAAGIGMVLRRGTFGTIANAIVLDFPSSGVNVRDMVGIDAAGDELSVTNSIFFNNGVGGAEPFAYGSGASRVTDTVFDEASEMNRVGMDPMLGTISDTTPSYVPPVASIAATGGATPPAALQTQATFVGAFGPGCPDWSAGWTAYPEN